MESIKAFERAAGVTRMAGEDRRQQIINIAIRLFSQRGFRGTTTKEIAHAAGVSEAIIFRHFATKQDLYAAILDNKACPVMADTAKLIAKATGRGETEAVFAAMAREILKYHTQDFEFYRLLLYSALEGHEISQMFRERYVRQNCELMDELIRERQRAGAIRDVDPMLIARAFFGMIVHHSLVNLLLDPSRTFLDISDDEAARKFAGILMHGIGTKKFKDVSVKNGRQRAQATPTPRKTKKVKVAPPTRAKKHKVN